MTDLSANDLDDVAFIHLGAFHDSLMTQFGAPLVRSYYETQLDDPGLIAFKGAVMDGKLRGFVLVGHFPDPIGAFRRGRGRFIAGQVARRPLTVLRVGLTKLPRLVPKLAGLLAKKTTEPDEAPVLLAIAVDPAAQRSGVGDELLRTAERVAADAGSDSLILYVNTWNDNAIRFYDRRGWERLMDGERWAGKMRKFVRHA